MNLEAHPGTAETTRRKVARRILPFVFVLYIVNYLDRANIAFAKLSMSEELGFSEEVYGTGAGIFFLGYLALEIPGALIVERWSARRWIARILITWGLCTAAVALVRTPGQFYAARFCLGLAEAGFYPGIIVYLTHWFTPRDRARAMSSLIVAIPVALGLGGPLSAALLRVDWLGLSGWQWVFIVEGLPAVVLGIVTLFYLTDRPRDATWLTSVERDWITDELEAEKRRKAAAGRVSLLGAFRQRNTLLLAAALFTANISSYAFVFWLPTIIRNALPAAVRQHPDWSQTIAAGCAASPYIAGLVAVLLASRSSDRTGKPRLHTVVPLTAVAVFFAASSLPGQPFGLVMVWLTLTGAAFYAYPPSFWVLPTLTLSGSAAAASIGMINSIGNLAGFFGPWIMGSLLARGYTYSQLVPCLSGCSIIAALFVAGVRVSKE
jgi:ACS family tartrate transporter-like MFS transporter